MASFTMRFFSNQLHQQTTVNVIMPEDFSSPVKTLWLLHGLSDDQNTWGDQTAIGRYASRYGIAVIMPCGDRSWYTDTAYGKNYFSFLTQELVAVCRSHFPHLSHKREDNMIAGNSMGGYGALKAAFTLPEQYGFCGSLSGSVDITRKNLSYNLEEWRSIFGFSLTSANQLEGSIHDLFALATKAKEEKKHLPALYLWCGTEDGLLPHNQQFSHHLTNLGIDHSFHLSRGHHTWECWDIQIQHLLDFWLQNGV